MKGPPSSFPSGHVARIAFLPTLAATNRVPAITVQRCGNVAASVFLRVYIGDHWVSDALAGGNARKRRRGVGAAWIVATE